MQLYAPPKTAELIPVIDISGPEREAAAAIGEACRNVGFFYVTGHGLPQALIDAQFAAARALFAVSEAEKQALHMRNSLSASASRFACAKYFPYSICTKPELGAKEIALLKTSSALAKSLVTT